MQEKEKMIKFVGIVRNSGSKKIITIPKKKHEQLNDSVEYYKIILIPVEFNMKKKKKKNDNS